MVYRITAVQSQIWHRCFAIKGPIHSKNRIKKTAWKTELNVLWDSSGFPSGLSVFCFVISVVFLCVWLWWIIQGCSLLLDSHIGHNVHPKRKRKMCSKKWYLESNISCDVHLLKELLETDVSWDDAHVVWAGTLRKLRDSLSELRSSVCERRLERQLRGLRHCLSKLRSLLCFSVRYDVTQ
jgi:hypothetical protein